jgi:glycosyltransferase involved in cell wall biosynthesis
MRIAQIAHLSESVPPRQYGGTERVLSYLTEELVDLGHEVTLFASGDSVTSARLVPVCPRAVRGAQQTVRDALLVQLLEGVFKSAPEFDLIHSHVDFLAFPLIRRCPVPVLSTLHGRLDLPELQTVYREFLELPLVSVSLSQRRPCPWASWHETIYHGLPSSLYRFESQPGGYLAFLGRMSPEKSPETAIHVARALGMPLRMAAKIDPFDCDYFRMVIEPRLSPPLIDFVGEITDADKQDFLGHAAAVICPYEPEPFGLVLIEALACGTPVITYRHGSFPELIEDGVTGFLCESQADTIRTVARLPMLDRRPCRQAFDLRFTAQRMARHYLAAYQALVDRARPALHGVTDPAGLEYGDSD